MQFYSISGVDGYYIYIITNPSRTVLYTGITNHLQRRLQEHLANKGNPSTFAGKYFCHLLLYYEKFSSPEEAIKREKQIKSWSRKKKEVLIRSVNPEWKPLNWELL